MPPTLPVCSSQSPIPDEVQFGYVGWPEEDCVKHTGWVAATEFIRHPSMVGSAFPATARMVRHMLAPINWSDIRLFVEYGPGSGRFTFAILERLHSDAKLLAVETGEAFVTKLRQKCKDPRLIPVEGSARDVRRHLSDKGLGQADCILSGLPFSMLDKDEAEMIMFETRMALKPKGLCLSSEHLAQLAA
ncbi:methyltransferase domain-containing protein [Sphingobium phenoxybenzoativorans]|uniref:Methyltransferase domain-containing protein n=1 Tax=Sphingobium phenoxybenzoativorans TaxID=1592790 RepID=A0A975K681_9SPHN|nr:methyltransferase domain-containing protein [Sphingobium phenoxybenzoativorans]